MIPFKRLDTNEFCEQAYTTGLCNSCRCLYVDDKKRGRPTLLISVGVITLSASPCTHPKDGNLDCVPCIWQTCSRKMCGWMDGILPSSGGDTVQLGRRVPTFQMTCCLHLLSRFFYPANGGSRFLWNVVPNYTASHPRKCHNLRSTVKSSEKKYCSSSLIKL